MFVPNFTVFPTIVQDDSISILIQHFMPILMKYDISCISSQSKSEHLVLTVTSH